MVCQKCGAENEEGGRVCLNCGTSLIAMDAKPTSSSIGLEQNVAGLLCYLLGWLTGLIFISLEKESDFVRFHAMQSFLTFGGLTAIAAVIVIMSWLPWLAGVALLLAGLFGALFFVLGFVLWVLLMVKAYQGKRYKLPWVGNLAEKYM